MPAPTITSKVAADDRFGARLLLTAVFTDTQETAAVKVDLSELAHAAGTELVTIEEIRWNISGVGIINVIMGATSVMQLSGDGVLKGGGLAGPLGDVKFTTSGFVSGSTYQVYVVVSKTSGYSSSGAPIPTEAELDEAAYVTGALITATVTFDKAVEITGIPQLELVIGENTRLMTCITTGVTDELEFEYTVVEEDTGEATEVEFGDIVLDAGARLSGGSPWGPAALAIVTSDLSAVTVNAAATVASVALTGDDLTPYATEDIIQVTVTMNVPVTVTGTPLVPLTITSGNKNASFVDYGADQTELIFEYEVEAGDIAEATGFDITGDIDLDGGTIVNEDAPAVAAVLTLAASDTSAVAVNPS